MSLHPRRQPSARVVCRRRGPTGVNGGALRPSGSFAARGRSKANRKNLTHRDEVEHLRLDFDLGAAPGCDSRPTLEPLLAVCAREQHPAGNHALPAGLMRWQAAYIMPNDKRMLGASTGKGVAQLCRTMSLRARAIVALRENVWRSRIRFRLE